jgi:hypothetical protein
MEEGKPSDADVERYSALYKAQLSSGDSQELDNFEIPTWQRRFYDDLRQKLRSQYHAQTALDRRNKLSSLLAQNPPFSVSSADYKEAKSRRGQKRRQQQFQQFVKRYAVRSNIGVHPFFASLTRLLEYQGSGQVDRACVWLFDDAVLMESGGDDWLENVVWILKGVLLFQEEGRLSDDPFIGEAEMIRRWTVTPGLSDPECRRLARTLPSFVLPKRGRGSKAVEHTIGDVEAFKEVELPTGKMQLSDTLRDEGFRGTLMERLWSWLLPRWY